MEKTVCIRVRGKVQGVYYRQSTKEKARSLDIKGKVSNLPDDSVEIIATGNESSLNELINWCSIGPPSAIVSNIDVTDIPFKKFDQFSIHRGE